MINHRLSARKALDPLAHEERLEAYHRVRMGDATSPIATWLPWRDVGYLVASVVKADLLAEQGIRRMTQVRKAASGLTKPAAINRKSADEPN
jgi:hypothetical protein